MNNAMTLNLETPFRDSLLCTPDRRDARMFGDVFVVFPIGEFKYAWSPTVSDLNFESELDKELSNTDRDQHDQLVNICENFLKTKKYKTTDINQNKNSETMIRCKQAYLVPEREYEFIKGMGIISSHFDSS